MKTGKERNIKKEEMKSRIQELETELSEYEDELKDSTFLQLDSSALMTEIFGLGAANTSDDHHDHEETEKFKLHIEELEEQ
ncbi:hypothetical protein B7P43_G13036, partial [Cryptotermes secundus]